MFTKSRITFDQYKQRETEEVGGDPLGSSFQQKKFHLMSQSI